MFVLQVPVSTGNWSESSSFLATISQPEGDSLSTLVSEISASEHRNGTTATIATMLGVSNSSRSVLGTVRNQTALFEKNTRTQQDQCWETYVGQVLTLLIVGDTLMNTVLHVSDASCTLAVFPGDAEAVHHRHDLHSGQHPPH